MRNPALEDQLLNQLYPQAELRSPDEVMKLDRMGSFFPSRLSFMRSTIRRLASEKAEVSRPLWELDDEGFGRAVYQLTFGGNIYSLVAFSTSIKPEMRTDRVIAEVWDSSFVLFDGIPSKQDIDRLEANVPRQEAGRFLSSELVLSRANKSVRLFEQVVNSLARGVQPDIHIIVATGYLMRTTAVYGNGKFGIADRAKIEGRPGLSGPFQAEMLTVWLIRNFTHDLVEHVARCKAPGIAVPLDDRLKRHLGIGNSTGLGMAPFLVNHPVLLNNWMMVRETALARTLKLDALLPETIARYEHLACRVGAHLEQWIVPDIRQSGRIAILRNEWKILTGDIGSQLMLSHPLERLYERAKACSFEAQELIVSFLLEPQSGLVDGLADCMSSEVEPRLDPSMSIGLMMEKIVENYQWALDVDLSDPASHKQFWYVSQEKLEPRLGDRFEDEGAELELPHDIAARVKALVSDLKREDPHSLTAGFVMLNPHHRYIVRRVQTTALFPYAEIRDNLVGGNCLPIDMLRCKLSFFGASRFDPKSDRWTRITLYQGAPLAGDLVDSDYDADDWWMPVVELL